MKRMAIVWPGFTGYLAGPWKELAKRAELRVWIEPSKYEQAFSGEDLEGIGWTRAEGEDGFKRAIEEIRGFSPDMIMSCGWGTPLCRRVGETDFGAKKIFAFDMPWEGRFRQIAARWVLRRYLRKFDAAFVPGKRAAKYARWLGFKKVVEGSNPCGWERFSGLEAKGRGFLFAGRLVKEKGLDVLLEAYRLYRAKAREPWGLDIAGAGSERLETVEGVEYLGFVAPKDMPGIVGDHGAFVLPSRWEPWGISALEAMSAGLKVIASEACGFTDDVKPDFLVKTGDVEALAEAMALAASQERGERREELRRYSDEAWAGRVVELALDEGGH